MKWLFILLVAANLLFFGYTRLAEAPPPVNWKSRQVKAEQLKLVAADAPKPVAMVAAADAPAAAPIASAEPAQPVVAEKSENKVEAKPAEKAAKAEDKADTKGGQLCLAWRGILPEDMPNARKQLAALKLGGEVKVDSSEPEGPRRFWVYIPPRPTNEDAQKKAEELKALGVDDFFVVNDGSRWSHAISLGLFSTQEAADRRLEMVKQKGVRTAVARERGEASGKTLLLRHVAKSAKADLSRAATGFKGSSVSETGC
ncbi:SPOR domain-containing protein [Chitinimonas sp.]|uniref:SPOR domain-containing protein n=1 Tax=Chitinimonas sp. TaxID=1934313 RepID=UPI002F94744E